MVYIETGGNYMDLKTTVDHIVNKIEKARLYKQPFPHLSIQNIFPDDVYAEMLEQFPTGHESYMTPLSAKYNNRFIMDLDDEKVHGGSNYRRHIKDPKVKKDLQFWLRFRKVMMSPELVNVFIRKYSEHLDPAYFKNAYPTARLSVDMKNYSIGPHRDRDDKLVSVMFYTPIDPPTKEIEEDAGTVLLTPKDPKRKFGNEHYTFDLFDVVKTAKYQPNSLFSWPVLHNSYHGVRPIHHKMHRTTVGYFIKTQDVFNRF